MWQLIMKSTIPNKTSMYTQNSCPESSGHIKSSQIDREIKYITKLKWKKENRISTI